MMYMYVYLYSVYLIYVDQIHIEVFFCLSLPRCCWCILRNLNKIVYKNADENQE